MPAAAEAATPIVPIEYAFEVQADAETVWKVHRLHVHEQLSRPYRATIDVATEDVTASIDKILGSPCALTMKREGVERRLCGIAVAVERLGRTTHDVLVQIEVAPALALLAHRIESRIFQEKTAPDILKLVLEEAFGPLHCELRVQLDRTYAKREYCVQYEESDLNFVHRLMEEEGIAYTFDHGGDREAMILFDKNDANGPIVTADGGPVPVISGAEGVSALEGVNEFGWYQELTKNKIEFREYDWTRPGAPPAKGESAVSGQEPELPVYYHWESERSKSAGNVKHLASTYDEMNACIQRQGVGKGFVSGFIPGFTFELDGHGTSELNQKYLITRVEHIGQSPESRADTDTDDAGDDDDGRPDIGDTRYVNHFECIPADAPFRPAQVTPVPRIHSLLTATVTGPGGEEIGVDSFGRIKVQFHWDRAGKKDDKSSCWVRVGQMWGGAGWGTQFIPRIGMEVLVCFVEGDPDKPIVVGSVYNGANMPAYAVPGSKTQSGIRTNSSPGGGGFNEIMFEDAAGSELVFHQAQKDLKIEVKNDKNQHVGHDEALLVDNDRSREIHGNQQLLVKKDDSSIVEGNQNLQVKGSRDTQIGGDLTEQIGGSHSESVGSTYSLQVPAAATIAVGGALAETVGAAKNVTVGGVSAEQVGMAKNTMVGGNWTQQIRGEVKLEAGKDWNIKIAKDWKVEIGKNITIKSGEKTGLDVAKELGINAKKLTVEAKDEIALKVGDSTIVIKKGEIVIKSKKITIESSGDVIMKGSKIAQN